MPLPNQPASVSGTSGGAILKPCERIPTKFATLEPCHNKYLFPIFLEYFSSSPSLLISKTSRTLSELPT